MCFIYRNFCHYKFTPLACFLVKYLEHECNMVRPVPPPCCLWVVRLSCLTAVGPSLNWVVLAGHYQPLTMVGHWPLPVLFGPALGDPGWPMVPVLWVAVFRGWLVCSGFDVCLFVCLFDLILYVPSTIFQLERDGSSWVKPVLS